MAYAEFHVNTDPMAQTLRTVTRQVDHTTQAVVVMQSAVIAAEQESANKICNNVNRGFATLIISQISQRKVKAESLVNAKLLEMKQLTAALRRIKQQMSADYHRISSRYLRVFTAVNESLRNSIWQCAHEAAALADTSTKELERRETFLGAATPFYLGECVPASQILTATALKRTAVKSISEIARFITNRIELKRSTNNMLSASPASAQESVCLPVMIVETDDLTFESTQKRMHVPTGHGGLPNKTKNEITAALGEAQTAFEWQDCPAQTAGEIKSACLSKVGASALDERIKKTMATLIESGNWRNLREGA